MEMTHAYEWEGRAVVDAEGQKIGKFDAIYIDQETEQPEWALVNTGLFGSKSSFVPLAGAAPDGDQLRVAVDKSSVKDAPRVDPDQELSEQEEAELFRHYGVPYDERGSVTATGAPGGQPAGEPTGHDTSGPTTDEAMTRSEEELRVGTERRERGRLRLRKYVVTENVTQTVPVEREEVRLEREPISEDNLEQATDGPAISEEEHEVVLHEEEPVVEKRVVPKERVRLGRETVTEERQVSEDVRREEIQADADGH